MLLLLLVAAAPGPLQVVKAGNDQLMTMVAKGDASPDKLATRADDYIDFGELAKRSLGKKWDELKPKQRDEFTSTLKAVLRTSYAQQAAGLGGDNSGLQWGQEQISGEEATVGSSVQVAGERISIEYKLLRKANGAWRVYDVVTDGVSLIEAYADQFRSVIAKKGFDGLMETLKKKRDKVAAAR